MLEHRAGGHFAHAQAVQVVALDQAFQGGSEHRLVAGGGVGPLERAKGMRLPPMIATRRN
jgi:hypothetical protein